MLEHAALAPAGCDPTALLAYVRSGLAERVKTMSDAALAEEVKARTHWFAFFENAEGPQWDTERHRRAVNQMGLDVAVQETQRRAHG